MNMARIDMAATCFAVGFCAFAYAQSNDLKSVRAAAERSEALRWFRKAAEQGSGSAEVEIGELYEAGLGVARDLDAAEQHYGAAADRITSVAFIKLAQLAQGGVGHPRNVVEAYKWYTLFLPFAGDDESTYRARRDALAAEM